MAADADIQVVRENVNEPDESLYSDEYIGALVDSSGSVESASAVIWRRKAAAYADLVNTSEAGASSSFSDLFKHATTMAESYESQIPGGGPVKQRAKVHVIQRQS